MKYLFLLLLFPLNSIAQRLDTIPVILYVSDTVPIYPKNPFSIPSVIIQIKAFEVVEIKNTADGVIDPGFYAGADWHDYYEHVAYLNNQKKSLDAVLVGFCFRLKKCPIISYSQQPILIPNNTDTVLFSDNGIGIPQYITLGDSNLSFSNARWMVQGLVLDSLVKKDYICPPSKKKKKKS